MLDPFAPVSELADPSRLSVLRETGLLDTPPEPAFDRVTDLVRDVLDAPVSLVSLVDDRRQFFKSAGGLEGTPLEGLRETPLAQSYCRLCVATDRPLYVEDADADPLFKDTPPICGVRVRAYAGHPLRVDGQVVGALCAIDLEPRRWSADDRRRLGRFAAVAAAEIERRLEERRAADRLAATRQDVHGRDRFLAAIGHELRNAINPATMTLKMMSHDTTIPAGLREDLAVLSRSCGDVRRLVADLSDRAWVSPDRLGLSPEPVDAAALVVELAEDLRREVDAADVRLEVELPDEPVTCGLDVHRVRQVLSNLVGNARKFTPAGGTITLRVDAAGGQVTFSVADTGVGFEPAAAARLFEPFDQLGGDGSGEGLGIGLAISRNIARGHGGDLTARSPGRGQGSVFTVQLPC